MHVKRSSLENYFLFFHINRPKQIFPYFCRTEDRPTFPDPVGNLHLNY